MSLPFDQYHSNFMYDDLESIHNVCQYMGIPPYISTAYEKRGIKSLYTWQQECIQSCDLKQDPNLIYCAPTSGGKTLIAELIIFKHTIVYRKKAIFILPYVSLVLEKEKYFKKLLYTYNKSVPRQNKIKICTLYGDININRIQRDDNIIICTIEKANALINLLILRELGYTIGCIVVDEMHTLGGSFNGYLLEILISKIKYFNQKSLLTPSTTSSLPTLNQSSNMKNLAPNMINAHPNSKLMIKIQLVAMSATVGNITQLAQWLQATLYISDYRPIPLIERIICEDKVYNNTGEYLSTIAVGLTSSSTLPLTHGSSNTNSNLSNNNNNNNNAKDSMKSTLSNNKFYMKPSTTTTTTTSSSSSTKSNNSTMKSTSTPSLSPYDKMNKTILYLCMDGLTTGQPILVFCPTKKLCQQTCDYLLRELVPLSKAIVTHSSVTYSAETLLEGRKKLIQTLQKLYIKNESTLRINLKSSSSSSDNKDTTSQQMTNFEEMNKWKNKETVQNNNTSSSSSGVNSSSANSNYNKSSTTTTTTTNDRESLFQRLLIYIYYGIAYHHADVDASYRNIIEKGFRSGLLSILISTSTLAAGVNLPAGRVIIRSLLLGKEDLTVTSYKQMVGRAGRVGHVALNYGESFLLVQSNELIRASQLINSSLPHICSQIDPTIDRGRGIMKAILEICSLDIYSTVKDIYTFIQHTLYYHTTISQCSPNTSSISNSSVLSTSLQSDRVQQDEKKIMTIIVDSLNFLIISAALDISKSISINSTATSSCEMKNAPKILISSSTSSNVSLQLLNINTWLTPIDSIRSLSITRFGQAIISSGLNPDDALVLYNDLIRVQMGLSLTSNLHLIYLITPLEHIVVPDFKKILSWYDHMKKQLYFQMNKSSGIPHGTNNSSVDNQSGDTSSLSSSNKVINNTNICTSSSDNCTYFIGDAIGLSDGYHYLNKWTFQPPSYDDIQSCYHILKQIYLLTWNTSIIPTSTHSPPLSASSIPLNMNTITSSSSSIDVHVNDVVSKNSNNSQNDESNGSNNQLAAATVVSVYKSSNNATVSSITHSSTINKTSTTIATTPLTNTTPTKVLYENKVKFEYISRCKRFYYALMIQDIINGHKTYTQIAKEYNCEVDVLETLRSQTIMMLSKIRKFCVELGWYTLDRIFMDLKDTLSPSMKDYSLYQQLFHLSCMTPKLAQLLHQKYSITSIQQVSELTSFDLAKTLYMSNHFQVMASSSSPFNNNNSVNSSSNNSSQYIPEKLISVDEKLMTTLTNYSNTVINIAKKYLLTKSSTTSVLDSNNIASSYDVIRDKDIGQSIDNPSDMNRINTTQKSVDDLINPKILELTSTITADNNNDNHLLLSPNDSDADSENDDDDDDDEEGDIHSILSSQSNSILGGREVEDNEWLIDEQISQEKEDEEDMMMTYNTKYTTSQTTTVFPKLNEYHSSNLSQQSQCKLSMAEKYSQMSSFDYDNSESYLPLRHDTHLSQNALLTTSNLSHSSTISGNNKSVKPSSLLDTVKHESMLMSKNLHDFYDDDEESVLPKLQSQEKSESYNYIPTNITTANMSISTVLKTENDNKMIISQSKYTSQLSQEDEEFLKWAETFDNFTKESESITKVDLKTATSSDTNNTIAITNNTSQNNVTNILPVTYPLYTMTKDRIDDNICVHMDYTAVNFDQYGLQQQHDIISGYGDYSNTNSNSGSNSNSNISATTVFNQMSLEPITISAHSSHSDGICEGIESRKIEPIDRFIIQQDIKRYKASSDHIATSSSSSSSSSNYLSEKHILIEENILMKSILSDDQLKINTVPYHLSTSNIRTDSDSYDYMDATVPINNSSYIHVQEETDKMNGTTKIATLDHDISTRYNVDDKHKKDKISSPEFIQKDLICPSHIPYTIIKPTPLLKRSSPYLTPYMSSHRHHSPGCYLYLPQVYIDNSDSDEGDEGDEKVDVCERQDRKTNDSPPQGLQMNTAYLRDTTPRRTRVHHKTLQPISTIHINTQKNEILNHRSEDTERSKCQSTYDISSSTTPYHPMNIDNDTPILTTSPDNSNNLITSHTVNTPHIRKSYTITSDCKSHSNRSSRISGSIKKKSIKIQKKKMKICYSHHICTDPTSTGFGYRSIEKSMNCRVFLQKLLSIKCMAFELIYHQIPIISPQFHTLHMRLWKPYISLFIPYESSAVMKEYGVSHIQDMNDIQLKNSMTKVTGYQHPHIIGGISMNFGDEYSYFMPLPWTLPYDIDYINTLESNLTSTSYTLENTGKSCDYRKIDICNLPLRCQVLICRYVGYTKILNKCPYLRLRVQNTNTGQNYVEKDKGINSIMTNEKTHTCTNKNSTLIEVNDAEIRQGNPLMYVSRHWCTVSRHALTVEWKKGQCIEWRLLNEMMSNPYITKVAMNIQMKLSALRERDVIVSGPLEDPTIAYQLLTTTRISENTILSDMTIGSGTSDDADNVTKKMKSSTKFSSNCTSTADIPHKLIYPTQFIPPQSPQTCSSKQYYSENTDLHVYQDTESLLSHSNSHSYCQRKQISIKVSCYRITAIMRYMSKLSFLLNTDISIYQLYHNIEMQLLYSVSDIEFHGINTDISYYYNIQIHLYNRLKVIDYYLKYYYGSQFNPASLSDVSKSRQNLSISCESILSKTIYYMQSHGLTSTDKYHYYLYCLQTLSNRLPYHPINLLLQEYRLYRHTLLPFCNHLQQAIRKRDNRILSYVNTLGTETGRLMMTHPNLQMVPKKDFYCHPFNYIHLHEEFQTLAREQQLPVAKICTNINMKIQRESRPIYVYLLNRQDKERYSVGKLVYISDQFISDEIDRSFPNSNSSSSNSSSRSSSSSSKIHDHQHHEMVLENAKEESSSKSKAEERCTLLSMWHEYGHIYTLEQASRIRQIIVEFCTFEEFLSSSTQEGYRDEVTTYSTSHRDREKRKRYYNYPADKVFRVDSSMKPNQVEQEILHKAWTESIWDCPCPTTTTTTPTTTTTTNSIPLTNNHVSTNTTATTSATTNDTQVKVIGNNHSLKSYIPNTGNEKSSCSSYSSSIYDFDTLLPIPSSALKRKRNSPGVVRTTTTTATASSYVSTNVSTNKCIKNEKGTIKDSTLHTTISSDLSASVTHHPGYNDIKASIDTTLDSTLKNLRHGFHAANGYILLSADYCQMELRLLTHFCQDTSLCDAFQDSKEDIFINIATTWLHKDKTLITKQEREMIKKVCYAQIYGSGIRSLAEDCNVSIDTTKQKIQTFHQCYPGIKIWIQMTQSRGLQQGYIETLLGRRRVFSSMHIMSEGDSNSNEDSQEKENTIAATKNSTTTASTIQHDKCILNHKEKSRIERQIINSICQGSAADLIKLAMVNISYRLTELAKLSQTNQQIISHYNKTTLGNLNCPKSVPFQYRCPRQFPGGQLYKKYDDIRLVLQIHDELVFEVREDLLPMVATVVKECMENAVQLHVPLQVKLHTGTHWNALQPYQIPVVDTHVSMEIQGDGTSCIENKYTQSAVPLARAIFGKEHED